MEEIYKAGSSSSAGYSGHLQPSDFGISPAFCDYGVVPMGLSGFENTNLACSEFSAASVVDKSDEMMNIGAKISSHPLYPKLLRSYIDCQKVGAPSEIVNLLENIVQENDVYKRSSTAFSGRLRDDPELDHFMATYCDVLDKFKLDLARPFNEATTFLSSIETQLSNLCTAAPTTSNISDRAGLEEESDTTGAGGDQADEQKTTNDMCRDNEIKDKLMRKYSGYITSLKQEFSMKNNKKGKLPREARQILLKWWTSHYKWPYPSEGDKIDLAESTGLDPKQINNWFINQRKRHWKPSENMQYAVMENIYGHFSE